MNVRGVRRLGIIRRIILVLPIYFLPFYDYSPFVCSVTYVWVRGAKTTFFTIGPVVFATGTQTCATALKNGLWTHS
jgi:hypothetical protein